MADENGYRVTKMISEVIFLERLSLPSPNRKIGRFLPLTKMISNTFPFQPIGNGPVMNKLGRAIVQMLVSGVETEYAIQAQPMEIEELEEEIQQENLTSE